ncbi:hypothetical protein PpBr36_04783 [Pyricularia pennisetigena]|uniref:hypothetical protein n=1 Tax=Pyricularia pennisetigena TaxID=1578925 RepID=UPI00114DB4D4|nr:hypothetical protein PpBr36_04783 [Pyricularia pennisetigena]TLS26124.1 hypothetical protein PpBr36_04783 [Pyricularia pennisetigena]
MGLVRMDLLAPMRIDSPTETLVIPAILVLAAWIIYRRRKAESGAGIRFDAKDSSPSNKLVFPPSRRHILHKLQPTRTQYEKGSFSAVELSPELLAAKALPTCRAPTSDDEDDGLLTPTGFTLKDLRALGRFPDYPLLSGVRDPEPCGKEFDISKATFRPFRPFRWGYHQTMSLMKLEPDYWIELEQNYHASMAARQELLSQHRDLIMYYEPGSELACRELMEMVVRFLCKRYPQYFRLEEEDEEEGDETILVNELLGTRTVVVPSSSSPPPAAPPSQHPLEILAATVPEDFALMLRNEDTGLYHLRAALICSSVGWDAGAKRGLSLADIHGPVVDYRAKMAFSMDRYFARLPTDKPIQRCSWTLEDCAPLFSSPGAVAAAQAGEQDDGGEGGGGGGWSRCAVPEQDLKLEDVQLRCDWQTLRRLPCSGAVAFNFKAVFTPLSRLRTEPFVPALLATVLRAGRPALVVPHKAVAHVRELVLPALDRWAEEQVEGGVVPRGWEAATLDEHPFYPGWEERWRAEQGF